MAQPGDSASERPRLIEGGLAVDERGQLAFVNDFDFAGVKRFYLVANRRAGQVRAWQAHRHEAKYVLAVRGQVLMAAVAIDDWQHPSPAADVHEQRLTADKPAVLYIPPGHANGWMSLTGDAQLMLFSTRTLAESQADDLRLPPDYWNIWERVS